MEMLKVNVGKTTAKPKIKTVKQFWYHNGSFPIKEMHINIFMDFSIEKHFVSAQ